MSTELAEPPAFDVVENHVGRGLVARRAFRAGEILAWFSWESVNPAPTRWSVQCGEMEHGNMTPVELRYLNHSCLPNVFLDVDAQVARILRDVLPGEELTYFYPSTEWSMREPFECCCGHPGCVGYVAGAAHVPADVLEQHQLSSVIGALLAARDLRGAA